MDKIEERIIQLIDEAAEEIIAFGQDVFSHGELGYKEFNTAKKFANFLDGLAIEKEEGLAITGVKGYVKKNQQAPTLALIGELDALRIPNHPHVNPETEAAHSCGHNAQLAAVVGATIALSDATVKEKLEGNLIVFAVPSEEYGEIAFKNQLAEAGKIRYGGGKSELIRIGAFDDIDVSIAHHSSHEGITVGNGSNNGFVSKAVRFVGKEAHAAAAPHEGVNALNAANVGLSALAFQRETFQDENHTRIHTVITKGGNLVNVIPNHVALESLVRGKDIESIIDASEKYDRSLKGGAYSIGAGIEIATQPGYLPLVPTAPHPDVVAAANLVSSKYPVKLVGEQNFTAGSTDVGDLQHIQPVYFFNTGGVAGTFHGSDFAISDPYEAYVVPAKIFALSAYRFLRDQSQVAKEAVDNYEARFTKEEYLAYMEKFLKVVNYDKDLQEI